jgi:hypothetical protein
MGLLGSGNFWQIAASRIRVVNKSSLLGMFS